MNKGYVAIVSVLIISAVATVIVLSLLTTGHGSQRIVITAQEERGAEFLSQACANIALGKIRLDAEYLGDEGMDIGANHCDILPIEESGGIYTIKTEGVVNLISRKNIIVVTRTEDVDTLAVTMEIESWLPVEGF